MKLEKKWKKIVTFWVLYIGIWLILCDGDLDSLWIGVPAVFLATLISTAFVTYHPIVWHEILGFVSFFILRSVRGGLDVAWRACRPNMSIDPDIIEYSSCLPSGIAQVIMANSISLLPGTLSVKLDQGKMIIHVLDIKSNFREEIEGLEQRLARVFALPKQQGKRTSGS